MVELIEAIADDVHPDEPCYGYVEVVVTPYDIQRKHNFVSAENWGVRRYGVTYVVRGDRLAAHVREMGLQENYACGPFRIQSWGDDTVGECWNLADEHRGHGYLWEKEIMAEAAGTSTVVEDFINSIEQNYKTAMNQTVVGPGFKKQRNGFPAEVRRRLERKRTI